MAEWNKIKQSCWRFTYNGKKFSARACMHIEDRNVVESETLVHSQLSIVTLWLYRLMEVETV